MLAQFQCIGAKFRLPGQPVHADRLSGGRVNETYRVTYNTGRIYVFQRLSEAAFAQPDQVMHNISLVTAYLADNPCICVQNYYTTADGCCLVMENGFWRVTDYIEARTFSAAEEPWIAEEAGRVYGTFLRELEAFPVERLHRTIPEFHNTAVILDRVLSHTENAETKPVLKRLSVFREMATVLENAHMPLRVTHGDTKCSNLLFAEECDRALMVIDLDTVMPGYAVYDFGDAIRSMAGRNGKLSLSDFQNFSLGYLQEAGSCLTDTEWKNLVPAAILVSAELAARYLEDYLTGASYFQVSNREELLERAKLQLSLAEDMVYHAEGLLEGVRSCTLHDRR